MSADRQQALNYLRAPAGGLWRWAENGAVIVWHDDTTLAFRQEIVQVLEWLAPHGLPPFGAIVFLLAACKGKVPAAAEIVREPDLVLPTSLGPRAGLVRTARSQLIAQFEAALEQFAVVRQLPTGLTSGIKARCILAEAVFEPAKVERHAEARAILRGLREPLQDSDLIDPDLPAVRGNYIRQIHMVAAGLKLHSAESLALRLRTGLDALPKEADLDLPPSERARRLIEELSRDPEQGAVGRAARELLAAVRLPRRLGERDQLAVGGLSDITNRGPLDRLLLSELAHDDLTLSVRVALNEALYLRREPPMREPPGALALLLDSGVRLWGVPRVLAAALALALVARDKQHGEVLAWRSRGKELQPVDLLSRRGLIEHLAALEIDAHPGESLPAFAAALARDSRNQSVVITHRDAFDDPEFRRALAESPPGFVAFVDRAGGFELHALPLARRRALCKADLDLPSVFNEKEGVPPVKAKADPSLPAIFYVSPFPLLLPLAGQMECWVREDDGRSWAVMSDRRVVGFHDPSEHGVPYRGGRVHAASVPGGRTVWMERLQETIHMVKAGSAVRPIRLLSLSLPEGPLRCVDLASGSAVLAVCRSGNAILLIRADDVRAHSLDDGRLLGRAISPHPWMNSRFFRGDQHLFFAAWDGMNIRFEPIPMPSGVPPATVGTVFERQGDEGLWLVLRNGEVISSNDGHDGTRRISPALKDYKVLHASRDGLRFRVIHRKNGKVGIFNTVTGQFNESDRADLPLDAVPRLPYWNVFRVHEAFMVLPDGFALRGRKNQWRKVSCDRGKIRISEWSGEPGPTFLFPAQARSVGYGSSLRHIEWPNGSKVFLDSRGLAHLQTDDPSAPAVSLVLSHNEVAGWTSDGHVCGPAFFFEEEERSEPSIVFDRVLRFLARL